MLCFYCEEIVTADELATASAINGGSSFVHRECMVRAVAGSVTHIRRECHAFGGPKDCHDCEIGLTKRDAARAAFAEFRLRDCSNN